MLYMYFYAHSIISKSPMIDACLLAGVLLEIAHISLVVRHHSMTLIGFLAVLKSRNHSICDLIAPIMELIPPR